MFDTVQLASHADIRAWAEDRGGQPALDAGDPTQDDAGPCRFAFGQAEEKLRVVSWDEFFAALDDPSGDGPYAVWAQMHGTDGGLSRYYKIVQRHGYAASQGGSEHPKA